VKLRATAEERKIAKVEPRARGRDKHRDDLILCTALRRWVEDVGGG
jgi:hypothetical protein